MMKKILCALKQRVMYYFLRRKKVNAKKSAYIKRPYAIAGGQYITVGEDVSIDAYAKLNCFDHYAGENYHPSVEIGDRVWSNRFLTILSAGKLRIGHDTFIGSHVLITNENHGIVPGEISYGLQALTTSPVEIGHHCWIGDHSVILPGVTIGEYCVIGAGSVVTKSIPPFCIAVGNPARIVKHWSENEQCWVKVNEEK